MVVIESNYGFQIYLVGPRGVLRMSFLGPGAGVSLRSQYGGSSLKSIWRVKWLFRWGLRRNPSEVYPLRLGRRFESEHFVYFANIIYYQGVKEGWNHRRNRWNHVWSLGSFYVIKSLVVRQS